MEASDWQRVRALFEAALERPEEARRAFLEAEAEGPVRDEALALLDADGRDLSLLDGDGVGRRLDRLFSHEGTRVGPYRVLEGIGEGGMGAVHLGARDDGQFEQRVALKLLRPGLAPARLLERFTEERRILARLEHPNIARLLDGGITETGQPWFAMEYVDGQPLGRWCDAHESSVEERLRLFLTVCDAVRYAHSRLVVHRDLKPDNILVAEDERGRPVVKLLDFGIAKLLEDGDAGLTRTEGPPLTPAYASPEQVAGEAVSTATDVYSLGVVLYELLSGQRPYRLQTGNAMELAVAIRTAEPERPSTA
ncbi:MAG: serine/threonine-protein kinase, partial [Pseudomonadales bacterium]|nr:serine/threonine-protein kinase [Pseudomonadales bacterium]